MKIRKKNKESVYDNVIMDIEAKLIQGDYSDYDELDKDLKTLQNLKALRDKEQVIFELKLPKVDCTELLKTSAKLFVTYKIFEELLDFEEHGTITSKFWPVVFSAFKH